MPALRFNASAYPSPITIIEGTVDGPDQQWPVSYENNVPPARTVPPKPAISRGQPRRYGDRPGCPPDAEGYAKFAHRCRLDDLKAKRIAEREAKEPKTVEPDLSLIGEIPPLTADTPEQRAGYNAVLAVEAEITEGEKSIAQWRNEKAEKRRAALAAYMALR